MLPAFCGLRLFIPLASLPFPINLTLAREYPFPFSDLAWKPRAWNNPLAILSYCWGESFCGMPRDFREPGVLLGNVSNDLTEDGNERVALYRTVQFPLGAFGSTVTRWAECSFQWRHPRFTSEEILYLGLKDFMDRNEFHLSPYPPVWVKPN